MLSASSTSSNPPGPNDSGLRRLPIPFMLVATVLTLGFFYPAWFLWVRPKLTRLNARTSVPSWPSIILFGALAVRLAAAVFHPPALDAHLIAVSGETFLNLCLLIAAVLTAVPAFAIKHATEQYLSGDDESSAGAPSVTLSGFQTFFFGAYYLQFVLNTAVLVEDSPEHLAEIERQEQIAFLDELHRATPAVFVTYLLIAVNVAIFIAMAIASHSASRIDREVLLRWGATFGPLVSHGQWWRVLTAGFLHVDFGHVAMNMIILWQVGRATERMLGNIGFLVVYLVAAVGASLTSVFWQPLAVAAGASGAIFGLFGAIGAFLLVQRHSVSMRVLAALANGAAAFVVTNLLLDLMVNAGNEIAGPAAARTWIDIAAHVGGLAVGFAAGAVVALPIEQAGFGRTLVRSALAAAAAAVLMVAGARRLPAVDDIAAALKNASAVETRSRQLYDATVTRLQAHEITAQQFADITEQQVLPPLVAQWKTLARLQAPEPQRPFVTGAAAMMALTADSWHLMAQGVIKNDPSMIDRAHRKVDAATEISRGLSRGGRPTTSRPAGTIAVSGTITDDRARPIAGARLQLTCPAFALAGSVADAYRRGCAAPAEQRSDATGHFRFEGMTSGPYIVSANAEGYRDDERDFDLEGPRELTFELRPLVDEVTAALKRFAAVEGQSIKRYNAALSRVRSGVITRDQFAGIVENEVLPPFAAERVALATVRASGPQLQLLETLKDYMTLREDGWRLLAEGIRKNDPQLLRQGSDKEAAAAKLAASLKRRDEGGRGASR